MFSPPSLSSLLSHSNNVGMWGRLLFYPGCITSISDIRILDYCQADLPKNMAEISELLGRSPGQGNGNSLQYSCLENPMDRGAWWATVTKESDAIQRLNNNILLDLSDHSLPLSTHLPPFFHVLLENSCFSFSLTDSLCFLQC